MGLSGEEIEDRIIEIMEGDAIYDDVVGFVVGFQYRVPLFMYPYCEVAVVSEEEFRENTNTIIRRLAGTIRFDVLIPDQGLTLVDRKAKVGSYIAVKKFINRTVQLFRATENRNLAELVGADWAVTAFEIVSDVAFGIDSRAERENSYENYGRVPFLVEVQEDKQ